MINGNYYLVGSGLHVQLEHVVTQSPGTAQICEHVIIINIIL